MKNPQWVTVTVGRLGVGRAPVASALEGVPFPWVAELTELFEVARVGAGFDLGRDSWIGLSSERSSYTGGLTCLIGIREVAPLDAPFPPSGRASPLKNHLHLFKVKIGSLCSASWENFLRKLAWASPAGDPQNEPPFEGEISESRPYYYENTFRDPHYA